MNITQRRKCKEKQGSIANEIYDLGCSIYGDRRGKVRFIEIADKVRKLEQQLRIARRLLERAGETMDTVRVFVTSDEQIKHPEGEDWYDEEREALYGLPYYSGESCEDEV